MTTRIIVAGALGRMGQAILRLAQNDPEIAVVGALEAPGRAAECGGAIAAERGRIPVWESLDAAAAVASGGAAGTVLIDFTAPEATRAFAASAARLGMKAVIGTTGLEPADHDAIRDAAQRTAVLVAANMSVGVNVLLGVVSKLAAALPDFDIEIVEMHHRHKKDAPSGTAVALARAAAEARAQDLQQVARHGRSGMVGARPAGEIGIHAVRGGDVVGDHDVIFAREGERIQLVHRAHSRDTFAAGSLRAARFLAGKDKGLYSMRDALGL